MSQFVPWEEIWNMMDSQTWGLCWEAQVSVFLEDLTLSEVLLAGPISSPSGYHTFHWPQRTEMSSKNYAPHRKKTEVHIPEASVDLPTFIQPSCIMVKAVHLPRANTGQVSCPPGSCGFSTSPSNIQSHLCKHPIKMNKTWGWRNGSEGNGSCHTGMRA